MPQAVSSPTLFFKRILPLLQVIHYNANIDLLIDLQGSYAGINLFAIQHGKEICSYPSCRPETFLNKKNKLDNVEEIMPLVSCHVRNFES